MDDYEAQLLAVEAKLAKDPDNEVLIIAKANIQELIELSRDIQEDEEKAKVCKLTKKSTEQYDYDRASSSKTIDSHEKSQTSNPVDKNNKHTLNESELLAKKKEKNRKKKAKLREKIKEQLDIAESEKQSWQSFANKKGLKGVTKKSIFASPCSTTGKVGVGTNGIADAPSVAGAGGGGMMLTKRKY